MSSPAERDVRLEARGVSKTYRMGSARLEVLKQVDLQVREGEILAVLGKSGCGKSTLLHVLGGLDRVDEGSILLDGQERARESARERARRRNETTGFVFQMYHLLPELTAFENVLMPALIRYGRWEWRSVRAREREEAAQLLERVGLADRARHRPRHLSGGERQRVAIARALMNRPPFLFCDEPTGNLDGRTAEDVRLLLWRLNEERGQTMVVVTHDARLARQAHRIVHLVDGRIVAGLPLDLVEEIPN